MPVTLPELRMQEQPLRTAEMAEYPYSDVLAARFTVATKFHEPVELWKKQGDRILLPRALCPAGLVDDRETGTAIHAESKVVPKDAEQARIIGACHSLLSGGESFILEAATGIGKTVIACDLICKMGIKTLVIVTKEDLMKQFVDELLKFTTLTADDIGVIQQDRMEVKGRSVVVALVHSLSIEGRYPDWLKDEFGLVIWDEVHRAAADTFSRTAGMFSAALRLGLSATPKRSDAKEFVFQAHIGSVRVSSMKADLTPKVFWWQSSWKAPTRFETVNGHKLVVRVPHSPSRMGGVINSIVKHPERNAKLVSLIKLAHDKSRKTVVFSDRTAHLSALRAGAVKAGVPPQSTALYVGGLSMDERERAAKATTIFATYGMMGEGTDIPALDTCILGTPRANVKQVIGRIRRLCEGKKEPVVFDIVDTDSPVLNQFWKSRQRWYRMEQAPVQKIV